MQLGVDLEQAILILFALQTMEDEHLEYLQIVFGKEVIDEAIDDLKKQLDIIIQILK